MEWSCFGVEWMWDQIVALSLPGMVTFDTFLSLKSWIQLSVK